MTNFKKTFFRYGISNVYMLVVMVFTFVIMFKGMDIYNQIQNEIDDENRYEFLHIYSFGVDTYFEDESDVYKMVEGINENVYFYNFNVGIGKMDRMFRVKVYLNVNKLKETYIEGSFISEAQRREKIPAVVVGKGFLDFTWETDGKRYIDINGNDYLVTGVVASKYSNYLDYSIMTTYDNMAKSDRDMLLEDISYDVLVESDNSVVSAYDKLKANVETMGGNVIVNHTKDSKVTNDDSGIRNTYGMMFLFCIVICAIAAEFFVFERKREISIRKTYGYSNIDIFKSIFYEVLKLGFLAAIIGIMIESALKVISGGLENLTVGLSLEYVAISVVLVFVSTFLIVLIPIIKVSKNAPAKMLG